MRYLLDTHAFLWFATGDENLSEVAKEIIENSKNNIYLSSASVWELSIKIIIGKLKLKKDLNKFIAENIAIYGYIPMPVTANCRNAPCFSNGYAGWRLQKHCFCASHTKAGVYKSKAFVPAEVVRQ